MRHLKKMLLFIIAPLIFISAQAQPGRKIMKVKTHRVIRRTAIVIASAHNKVKENKVYTGNLGKAVAHQKFARSLFRRGMYARAIHHSRRARLLAAMAIKANKGEQLKEETQTDEENELMKNAPSDDELEKELLKEMPKESLKDEDAVSQKLDVDLSDKE